jgi:hypothetical protein
MRIVISVLLIAVGTILPRVSWSTWGGIGRLTMSSSRRFPPSAS